MRLCTSDMPDVQKGLYITPYTESVDGYRHGYRNHHGLVQWTRNADHPADAKCPECAATTQ